jgi:hypothetical protein
VAAKTLPKSVAAIAERPKPREGDIAHLRSRIAYGRSLELEIAQLAEEMQEKTTLLTDLRTRELVDLFERLGTTGIDISADGNLPAYDAALKPYYSANLPKDEEARDVALAFLKANKAEDLSKTKVEIQFGRGEGAALKKMATALRKMRIPFVQKTGVHASTLTAWVRERFESGRPLAPADLQTIGATVGKVVVLMARKE